MNEAIILGVCQTPVLRNRQELLPFLDEAARKASSLNASRPAVYILPELFWGGFAYESSRTLAAETPGLLAWLHDAAAERHLLLGGTFWEALGPELRNTFHLVGLGLPAPRRIRSKRRLFPLSDEERHFTSGAMPLQTSCIQGFQCGTGICFELRFPEIFREQAAQGMDVLLLSSQWPASRGMHLDALVRARAIENQCFVLSCNACGPSLLGPLAGGSCCITPWGEDLFRLADTPAVACAPCPRSFLDRARAAFNSRPSGMQHATDQTSSKPVDAHLKRPGAP